MLILLANSHGGPFGRDLGKSEGAGQANPRRQTPGPNSGWPGYATFAHSIYSGSPTPMPSGGRAREAHLVDPVVHLPHPPGLIAHRNRRGLTRPPPASRRSAP